MIDQALYTHSKTLSGWGVVASTRPLDLDLEELIRVRSAYRFPVASRVTGDVPALADDETALPPSLRLVLQGPFASLASVQPSGRELSGSGVRGGNVIAHLLLAEDPEALRSGRAIRPIQMIGSPSLLDHEPESFDPRPLDALDVGAIVDDKTATAVATGWPEPDTARDLVAAVLRAHWSPDDECAAVCVVGSDAAEVVGWLSVVAYWLPVGLTWQIAFDSFSARPDQVVKTGPNSDEQRLGVTLCGAVSDLLERGGVDPSTLLFDFTAGERPRCAPVGRFAERLLASSFVEGRPLLGVIDDLAECSAVPDDESGWVTLLAAASLLLGDEVGATSRGAVATWLADHAESLGAARVEVLASALDTGHLVASDLLAIVAAASRVDSTSVIERFEERAFELGLEQVLDRQRALPPDLPFNCSPLLRSRAAATLSAELERKPADVGVRLLRFASSMEIDIAPDVVQSVGRDLVGVLVEHGESVAMLPEALRGALAAGMVAQLEQEPLSDASAARLKDGIKAAGLLDTFERMDLADHSVAAILIFLEPSADDEARLAIFRNIMAGEPRPWPTIDRIISALWPGSQLTLAPLESLVRVFAPPIESSVLAHAVRRLLGGPTSLDELERLNRLVEVMQVGPGTLTWLEQTKMRGLQALVRAEDQLRAHDIDEASRQIGELAHQDLDLARAMTRRLGRSAIRMSAHDVLALYTGRPLSMGGPFGPGSMNRSPASGNRRGLAAELTEGIREGIAALDDLDDAQGLKVVGRVAPGMLAVRDEEALGDVCRQLVPRWDAERIAQVQALIAAEAPNHASKWAEWAGANLRRRRIGGRG